MTNWQPIDTAPKDGTRILLSSQRPLDTFKVTVGMWRKWESEHLVPAGDGLFRKETRLLAEGWTELGAWGVGGLSATHWQPLPEPFQP